MKTISAARVVRVDVPEEYLETLGSLYMGRDFTRSEEWRELGFILCKILQL